MPAVHSAIINYGCPRSGTTVLMDMLQRGKGYLHWRLTEYAALHPCQSPRGLLDLHEAITINARYRHCIIVRTVRHPIEIAKSAWCSWHQGDWRKTAWSQEPVALNPENIAETIRNESVNTIIQQGRIAILEARYEDLGTTSGRETFLAALNSRMQSAKLPALENTRIFQAFLAEWWNKKPIGEGRFALGDAAQKPPDDVVQQWRIDLKDVIEREGYSWLELFGEKGAAMRRQLAGQEAPAIIVPNRDMENTT